MLRLFVPRKGLSMRDPKTHAIIPETGMQVEWDSPEATFWRRRVNCGDGTVEDIKNTEEKPIKGRR